MGQIRELRKIQGQKGRGPRVADTGGSRKTERRARDGGHKMDTGA